MKPTPTKNLGSGTGSKASAASAVCPPLIPRRDPKDFKNPITLTAEDLRTSKPAVTLERANFEFKSKALEALMLLNAGKCVVLVGSAGTGKSTLILDWLKGQITDGRLPPVLQETTAYYKSRHIEPVHSRLLPGSPGFLMGALSHRVTQRLAKDMPGVYSYTYKGETYTCSIHQNVMTMHKATEYKPTQVDVLDSKTQETETKIHFVPTRGSMNPIPDIKVVILDEAGQIRLDLGRAIVSACPGAQIILLGDLGQVGAVASLGMLGVAIATTNSIELDHVYRSEGQLLAWGASLREGVPYKLERGGGLQNWHGSPDVTFLTYDRPAVQASAANTYCANILFALILQGKFTFGLDMALCPQVPTKKPAHDYEPEKFGVAGIWQTVAEKLDAHYGRHTYLIRTQAGPKVVAAGDTYIISTEQGQQEFMLMGMSANPEYQGIIDYPPMLYNTRDPEFWIDGIDSERAKKLSTDSLDSLFSEVHPDDFDMLNHKELSASDNAELSDAKSQYSLTMLNIGAISAHIYGVFDDPDKVLRAVLRALELLALQADWSATGGGVAHTPNQLNDMIMNTLMEYGLAELVADVDETSELIRVLSNTGQINTMIPSITTVHKAQGSEAPLVVCMWHHSAIGQTRELLYTANTRARLKVVNICDSDTFSPVEGLARSCPLDRQSVAGTSLAAKRLTYKRKLSQLGEGPEKDNAEYLIKFFQGVN